MAADSRPSADLCTKAPEPRTAVGEGAQRCVLGAPDSIQVPADQYFEIRISFADSGENLPPTSPIPSFGVVGV